MEFSICFVVIFFESFPKGSHHKKTAERVYHWGGGIFFHPLYGGREVLKISNLPIFHSLFFTLSVEGGRGKVNDANFTLSAVFFGCLPLDPLVTIQAH